MIRILLIKDKRKERVMPVIAHLISFIEKADRHCYQVIPIETGQEDVGRI